MSNRIEHEGEGRDPADQLGDKMATHAWPGIFGGGKQIIYTMFSRLPDGREVMNMTFSDNSALNIVGVFDLRFVQPGDAPTGVEALKQHGVQLMQGTITAPQTEEEGDEVPDWFPDGEPSDG